MKHLNRAFVTIGLIALGVAGHCQESSLLAKCLGEPRAAYAKAFEDKTTWVQKTPQGNVTVGQYKTGSAMIEVIQTSAAKTPDVVNVNFYQEPKMDWKLALKVIGLSSEGVVAKEDSQHRFHLTGIKAKKSLKVEAVFAPMAGPTSNGPELHLKLLKK
jgi:hypothetical protein